MTTTATHAVRQPPVAGTLAVFRRQGCIIVGRRGSQASGWALLATGLIFVPEQVFELCQKLSVAQEDFCSVNERLRIDDVAREHIQQFQEFLVRPAAFESLLRAVKEE